MPKRRGPLHVAALEKPTVETSSARAAPESIQVSLIGRDPCASPFALDVVSVVLIESVVLGSGTRHTDLAIVIASEDAVPPIVAHLVLCLVGRSVNQLHPS